MEIRIEIDRPIATAISLAGLMGALVAVMQYGTEPTATGTAALAAVGGDEVLNQVLISKSEADIRRARQEQAVLLHREEILRYQMKTLEERRRLLGVDDPELTMQFRTSVRMLSDLLLDKHLSERRLQESFMQLWEAQERALLKAQDLGLDYTADLIWPLEPEYGISAGFMDQEYKSFFGIEHKAIDIPALQGTTIVAADDGVVEEVVDNGLGFSWVTIRHEGFVTLYGHVSDTLVEEGRYVWKGDPIAKSGGMPGTPGAGSLSTGPHLHFELMMQAGNVNPLFYLPQAEGVEITHDW